MDSDCSDNAETYNSSTDIIMLAHILESLLRHNSGNIRWRHWLGLTYVGTYMHVHVCYHIFAGHNFMEEIMARQSKHLKMIHNSFLQMIIA